MNSSIPPDDPRRTLTVANPDDPNLPHVAVAGGTYTVLLSGKDTGGRYCLIDMLVPSGGGPPLHRHDFEESFTVVEGQIVATFRGEERRVRAGEVIHIPANAPHRFQNTAEGAARLLCLCAPAGQEEFFLEVGTPVQTRTTPAPKLDVAQQEAVKAKIENLSSKYKTELL